MVRTNKIINETRDDPNNIVRIKPPSFIIIKCIQILMRTIFKNNIAKEYVVVVVILSSAGFAEASSE